MNPILKKINLLPFEPLFYCKTGHQQTILSQVFSYLPSSIIKKKYIIHSVSLSDDDQIILIENPPIAISKKSKRIILLVHGLTGSQNSSYMKRGARYLAQDGLQVFRMNLRGCGAGFHYAKKLYHSGRSQDVYEVIAWLSIHYPSQPITLIGFSLGANLVLKLAGELGQKMYSLKNLDSILAISPPLNLEASVKLLNHKKNKFFNQYFVKKLVQDINAKNKFISGLPFLSKEKVTTVLEFDKIVTAPQNNFKNAKDYYQKCSSRQFIPAITLPTLILHSTDDPFIGNADFYNLPKKKNIDLLMTQAGGHVSWIGKTDIPCHYRWMDRVILKWINWIDSQIF